LPPPFSIFFLHTLRLSYDYVSSFTLDYIFAMPFFAFIDADIYATLADSDTMLAVEERRRLLLMLRAEPCPRCASLRRASAPRSAAIADFRAALPMFYATMRAALPPAAFVSAMHAMSDEPPMLLDVHTPCRYMMRALRSRCCYVQYAMPPRDADARARASMLPPARR
jgi:hypothetical protein